jgi:hypothetical protein
MMEFPNSKEGCTGFLGFSGEEVLVSGDVQRDPAGERDASLEAFLASCGDQINTLEVSTRKQRQQEEKSRSASTASAYLLGRLSRRCEERTVVFRSSLDSLDRVRISVSSRRNRFTVSV